MKTVTLKSGNTLQLQEASFIDAWNFTQAIAKELSHALPGLKLDSLDADMLKQDIDVGKLIGVVAHLISSKEVFGLAWAVLAPCLYNDHKVTQELFQDPRARADFLPVVVEAIKLNVLPFIQGLDLKSLTSQPAKALQKSQK